jgi:DNA repair exonuclease SbcCD ATPase subunit
MTKFSDISLDTRMEELTRQLKRKDEELDDELDKLIQADEDAFDRELDAFDRDIEATGKNLQEGKKRKVEAVKKGIRDRKYDLRQKIEAAKKAPKDHASKEAENALNKMQEDLSNEDLVSAHIDRWVANQWLKLRS